MNNTLVVGKATRDRYIDALLKLCDPEGLVLYTNSHTYCNELEEAAAQLNLPLETCNEDNTKLEIGHIIAFTDYIGIEAVNLLTEANNGKIPITFLNT